MQMPRSEVAHVPPSIVASIGLLLIGAYVSILLILADRTSFDVWGAVLVAPALVAASVPALRRQAARETDPRMFRHPADRARREARRRRDRRYYVAFSVYGGMADADAIPHCRRQPGGAVPPPGLHVPST